MKIKSNKTRKAQEWNQINRKVETLDRANNKYKNMNPYFSKSQFFKFISCRLHRSYWISNTQKPVYRTANTLSYLVITTRALQIQILTW